MKRYGVMILYGKAGVQKNYNSFANFVGDGLEKNYIFQTNSVRNRDNCLEPYNKLRKAFLRYKININTPDINIGKNITFELQMDVQKKVQKNIPTYLLLIESPQIRPSNNDMRLLSRYKLIFTWRDDLVDNNRFIKMNLPNELSVDFNYGWEEKVGFCCLIANNKTLPHNSSSFLYSERINAIRWFEKFASSDFDLYGSGWEKSPAIHGILGRIINRLGFNKLNDKKIFSSYLGPVENKIKTLKKYRFCICYENVDNLNGYITEKIFDCFFSGCIPIYLGAENISDYIPANCFIDKRNFSSYKSLYNFMKTMKENDYIDYQKRIKRFLKSDTAKLFSSDKFVNTVVSNIIDDLRDKKIFI